MSYPRPLHETVTDDFMHKINEHEVKLYEAAAREREAAQKQHKYEQAIARARADAALTPEERRQRKVQKTHNRRRTRLAARRTGWWHEYDGFEYGWTQWRPL